MKKILSIFLFAAIIVAGCGSMDAKTAKKATKKTSQSSSAGLSVSKGEIKEYGDYLTTQLFTIKKGKYGEIKVEYPIKGNTQLVNSIRNNIKRFINEKFTGSLETPDALLRSAMKEVGKEYQRNLHINISYDNGNVVTYKVEGDDYSGGAHGLYWKFGRTFLVADGKVFDENMMPSFSSMRKHILDGMARKMDMPVSDVVDGFYSSDSLEDYGSVSITADGIYIVYQPYEIGPYMSGLFESVIPISEVYNLFSPEAQKFLK